MADNEYVELARELRNKMREFIHESEPGEAVIPLHKAYAVVKAVVEAADPDSEVSRRKRRVDDAHRTLDEMRDHERQREEQKEAECLERERQQREGRESRESWTVLDRNVKMGRILTALSTDALVRREIVERINVSHPGISVYESDIVALMNEMLAAGELEREKEPRGPNCSITAKGGIAGAGVGVGRRSRPSCKNSSGG